MTEMLYASSAVNPVRKSMFVGYDFLFQNVRSINPIAPNSESHIIQLLVWIQFLYESEKKDTDERAVVRASCTVRMV